MSNNYSRIWGRWKKEPLLHFALIGGLLFAVYGWLNDESDEERGVVRITAADVDWLTNFWTRQHQLPPSNEELRGLVTGYLKEKLLAREAIAFGLDQDDTVVRRRLAQKMEFVIQDTVYLQEPDDTALHKLYDSSPDKYRQPARLSFTQIYFKSQDTAQLGLKKVSLADNANLGDPSMLARDYNAQDNQAITSQFGEEFTTELFKLETARWHGPVTSTYGFHLVYIHDHQAGKQLTFDEVRNKVVEEWYRLEKEKSGQRFYDELLKKYDVVMDDSVAPLVGPLVEAAQ